MKGLNVSPSSPIRLLGGTRRLFLLGLVCLAVVISCPTSGGAQISNYNEIARLRGFTPFNVAPPPAVVAVAGAVESDPSQVLSVAASAPRILIGFENWINSHCISPRPQINGCAGVPAALDAPLPVIAVVDGVTLDDVTVTSNACGAMAWALLRDQTIDWTTAYQRGVAYSVMQQLVYAKALVDGHVVSDVAAQAYAQRQLNAYLQDPNHPPLASGTTPEDVFTSPAQVRGYKVSLSIAGEKRALVAAAGVPLANSDDQSRILLAWFASELPAHTVSVQGLPSFDPGAILPLGTM